MRFQKKCCIAVLFAFLAGTVFAGPVEGTGVVTSVNQPGNSTFDTFQVRFNDVISYATWAPDKDVTVGESRYAAGQDYNLFIIDSSENKGTQAFIAWESRNDGYLRKVKDKIYALGEGAANTLKKGDTIKISSQTAEGKPDYLDVTIDVWRDNKAVATFSFITKNPFK